jgi:hypothetical protein
MAAVPQSSSGILRSPETSARLGPARSTLFVAGGGGPNQCKIPNSF